MTGPRPPVPDEEEDDFYRSVPLDDFFADLPDEDGGAGGKAGSRAPELSPEDSTLEVSPDAAEVPHASPSSRAILPPDPGSLSGWVAVYYRSSVERAPRATEAAKRADLERFLNFFVDELGHDRLDAWVPEVTGAFQRRLRTLRSERTGQPLAPASVNRILSTVRNLAAFLGAHRPLRAGDPCRQVRRLPVRRSPTSSPDSAETNRLWKACLHRLATCRRRDQNPLLEAALFQLHQGTGLRPRELAALDLEAYHSKSLHGLFRRGRTLLRKVWVPAEARRWLERYLDEVRGRDPGPLFLSRTGCRMQSRSISRALAGRLAQAPPDGEQRLTS